MTSPVFPFSVTMTLIKRILSGTQDEYGNDVYNETRITVRNCVFAPSGSSESLVFQDQVSTTDTIFMPAGTDVSPLDAIEWNGNVYEVTGEVSAWTSPFSGRVSPIRVDVTRIKGVAV
jgi:hypothetical protein